VQVARGALTLNGESLAAGDGAALSGERVLEIEALDSAHILVFDLA
jgi:redox-sensitive bicupin YhaK (pirin superfamily)